MTARASVLCLVAVGVLSGCSLFNDNRWHGNDPDAAARANDPYHTDPMYDSNPDVFGDRHASDATGQDSILSSIFGNKGNKGGGGGGGGAAIGVNSYLWHATLDTVSFMPLASADPFGGVIITDWYSPPGDLNERFKVNIFILGRELRADGVRASVFRQTRAASGQWLDAAVDPKTGTDLENAILTRARQMRLSTTAEK
ncbi:MAG TPA: DUF3576 domain-containing protein [Stellaceae bacterium]|nr:DUF3576 domain-containing protein [Stellaceae bacterium]